MMLIDESSHLNLNSKRFKAIKHIVLHWQGRELLRLPYPIFLIARMPFSESEQLSEVSHSYRGKYVFLYFTADDYYGYPMHLKRRFPKREFILEEELEEYKDQEDQSCEELFYDPVKNYFKYFPILGLSLSPYSFTTYKIYCEMFDQSQKIVQNMELDRANLFEGVEDIKLDVSESPYKEEFVAAWKFDQRLLQGSGFTRFNLFGAVERYYQNCSYRYDLEESKRVFLTHLGEQNANGYCGLNENTFKRYSSRLQLSILFNIHRHYVRCFSREDVEGLEKVNLWKQPLSLLELGVPLLAAESFYVKRFYRKFNLFTKS